MYIRCTIFLYAGVFPPGREAHAKVFNNSSPYQYKQKQSKLENNHAKMVEFKPGIEPRSPSCRSRANCFTNAVIIVFYLMTL